MDRDREDLEKRLHCKTLMEGGVLRVSEMPKLAPTPDAKQSRVYSILTELQYETGRNVRSQIGYKPSQFYAKRRGRSGMHLKPTKWDPIPS